MAVIHPNRWTAPDPFWPFGSTLSNLDCRRPRSSRPVARIVGRRPKRTLSARSGGLHLAWLEHRGGALEEFAFPSWIDDADHISTRQYVRLVNEWVTGTGLRPEDYGTHSLRRTKASIIYKQTGNLRAVQILLGHTKIDYVPCRTMYCHSAMFR